MNKIKIFRAEKNLMRILQKVRLYTENNTRNHWMSTAKSCPGAGIETEDDHGSKNAQGKPKKSRKCVRTKKLN